MTNVVSMHVLYGLEELAHDATYMVLAEHGLRASGGLGRCLEHLQLLLPIMNEPSQTALAGELEHEIAPFDLGVFVVCEQFIDQVTVYFL